MTVQYLPSPQNQKEYFEISIEDQQFTVSYDYNSRDDIWYLTLTKDGINVLNHVRMTMGYNFGYNYLNFPLTKGNLFLYSPSNEEVAATKDTFGKSVYLVYEPTS